MVAQAAQRSARMIAAQAERDGWLTAPPPSHDIGAKVREVANMLVARIEEASRAALENGGIINKSEIELAGLSDQEPQRAYRDRGGQQSRGTSPGRSRWPGVTNCAAILKRINERIVELAARSWAARTVGARCCGPDGADLIEGSWVVFARLTQ